MLVRVLSVGRLSSTCGLGLGLSRSIIHSHAQPPCCDCIYIHTTSVTCKGHSKWQNIKHTKAAHEKIRCAQTLITMNEIKHAIIRNGKIGDPKLNKPLANAMDKGKKNGILQATMQRTINRTLGIGIGTQQMIYGYMGPHGSSFLTVIEAEKPTAVNQNMRATMKKSGYKPKESKGPAMRNFDEKGVVEVYCGEGKAAELEDEDAALGVAIEVGAEEVLRCEDPDGGDILRFICSIPALKDVRRALEEGGYEVASAVLGYHPTNMVTLSEEEYDVMRKCFSKLYEIHPELIKIYDNME